MASEVPVRHLAITARVPTGQYCTGCDFCGAMTEPLDTVPFEGQYQVVGHVCCLQIDGCDGEEPEWEDGTDLPLRLPACLARDAYAVIEPGTALAEMIEELARWRLATRAGGPEGSPEPDFNLFQAQVKAANELILSRRVAEERRK